MSYLVLGYTRLSVQPSGDGGSEQCQNKQTNKGAKCAEPSTGVWLRARRGEAGLFARTTEEEPAAVPAGEAVRKAGEDAIAARS